MMGIRAERKFLRTIEINRVKLQVRIIFKIRMFFPPFIKKIKNNLNSIGVRCSADEAPDARDVPIMFPLPLHFSSTCAGWPLGSYFKAKYLRGRNPGTQEKISFFAKMVKFA